MRQVTYIISAQPASRLRVFAMLSLSFILMLLSPNLLCNDGTNSVPVNGAVHCAEQEQLVADHVVDPIFFAGPAHECVDLVDVATFLPSASCWTAPAIAVSLWTQPQVDSVRSFAWISTHHQMPRSWHMFARRTVVIIS